MDIKVLREFTVDDPEEDVQLGGGRIQLRLFELQAYERTFYVSAEQKRFQDGQYKYGQLFNVDGTVGPRIPTAGYNALLAARDEYLVVQSSLEASRQQSDQRAAQTLKASREAWHVSVAARNAANKALREHRRRTQLEAKILRLKGELAAAELELLGV